MMVDLNELAKRESEQVEWKENVADENDVVATLTAFANDLQNLGGGYVVCGAQEGKDEYGFPKLSTIGLTASRLSEVEGKVLQRCRERVEPSIQPLVEELPGSSPDRRILVFIMPATRFAHQFRKDKAGAYYVRSSRSTIEARNGLLRELLVRKGAVDPWDRRPCVSAGVEDLDLLVLRDTLNRMKLPFGMDRVDEYLSEAQALSPLVPSLCVREPLTGVMRPRNFAILLFGRNPQAHIPGSYSLFSIYPGQDRSEAHAERHELTGSLIDQARRLASLLDSQAYLVYDKKTQSMPNALRYPVRALHEAMINVLAHRDYELVDPSRITAFEDRVEFFSPGSLPTGLGIEELRAGRAAPRWRNQSLAWILMRLQLAQAEGQGIPTILRTMREEGCPPAEFQANESRVTCILPAHPRHLLWRELSSVEQLISAGELEIARQTISRLLAQYPANPRVVELFANVHRLIGSTEPVLAYLRENPEVVGKLSPIPIDALLKSLFQGFERDRPTEDDVSLVRHLVAEHSSGVTDERTVISDVQEFLDRLDYASALAYLCSKFEQHPRLRDLPALALLRSALFTWQAHQLLEKQDGATDFAKCDEYLSSAERDLLHTASLGDPAQNEAISRGLGKIFELRSRAHSGEKA